LKQKKLFLKGDVNLKYKSIMNEKKKKYANPYLAGFALGLTLLFTFWIGGHGLGSSGAIKNFTITLVQKFAPQTAEQSYFFGSFDASQLWSSWIVIMFLGAMLGGFLSGAIGGRLKFQVDRGPRASVSVRLIFALIGGALFGIGAQLGKGCTSGAALSGMAVLSTSGILTMMAIFGTGFMIAFLFRKLWV
jgi:uncharacterized protein